MIKNLKKITIYTDGACSGNPGIGGWGAVLEYNGKIKEISGVQEDTTNNQMEMLAAVKALESLKEKCEVELYTDSKYLKDGITAWVHNWQKNGWKTANKKPVKNVELWQNLLELQKKHVISWRWIKGHDGNPGNELADKLATEAIKSHNI